MAKVVRRFCRVFVQYGGVWWGCLGFDGDDDDDDVGFDARMWLCWQVRASLGSVGGVREGERGERWWWWGGGMR